MSCISMSLTSLQHEGTPGLLPNIFFGVCQVLLERTPDYGLAVTSRVLRGCNAGICKACGVLTTPSSGMRDCRSACYPCIQFGQRQACNWVYILAAYS